MPTSTRRTASKVIYFHREELARITGRARACGQTPARFIREAALGGTPKRAADPLLTELALIGRRLDQIARLPETERDGALAEEVRAALDRHWALVRRVLADRRRGGGSVPVIAETSSGQRFAALAHYLLHGRSGEESERVAWTAGRNLGTDDPDVAAALMQNTAARNERVESPVYHLTISFDPNDPITPEQMQVVVDRVLRDLGLAEHQAVLVAHQDRAHPHVHLMINRVHPETGVAWDRWQDQPRIQRALRELERELGLREVAGRLYQLDGQEPPERAPLTNGERRQAERTGEPAFPDRVARTCQSCWNSALLA